MELGRGRLASYAVRVTGEGAALPISFDQGRHVGAGQRPGSWMAFAMRLSAPAPSREQLAAAWDAVVARHGTLRSVFGSAADGTLELREVFVAPGDWQEHEVAEGRASRDVLRELLDEACAPFARPSHRLVLLEPDSPETTPELVLGSDHSHVDMWTLVLLARDLLAAVEDLRAGRPPLAAAEPVAAFSEHSAALDAMPSAPDDVHQRWADILGEAGVMPRFPLPLGQLHPPPAEVVEVRDVLDAGGTERLSALAREQGVRLIALGMSVLTRVTMELSGAPLRAVFPVHSRHEPRWREAAGWFITNAVIESLDPGPAACMTAVHEATELGSWPLGPILAPYGGMKARPGMFAVSWLDVRRLPVPTAHASDLRYVSAAIRTDGVMIWFIVNEDGLHLRCRYPDTPEARHNVGRWLDGVEAGLRELVGGEVPA